MRYGCHAENCYLPLYVLCTAFCPPLSIVPLSHFFLMNNIALLIILL
uniref:Uncharacterized protein n=1 Tax=Arundo donax TaxID=35708 RepID=A0A0A9AQB8_ARUDO